MTSIILSGAGFEPVDGSYLQTTEKEGRSVYSKDSESPYLISYVPGVWRITTSDDNAIYYVLSESEEPPEKGWLPTRPELGNPPEFEFSRLAGTNAPLTAGASCLEGHFFTTAFSGDTISVKSKKSWRFFRRMRKN